MTYGGFTGISPTGNTRRFVFRHIVGLRYFISKDNGRFCGDLLIYSFPYQVTIKSPVGLTVTIRMITRHPKRFSSRNRLRRMARSTEIGHYASMNMIVGVAGSFVYYSDSLCISTEICHLWTSDFILLPSHRAKCKNFCPLCDRGTYPSRHTPSSGGKSCLLNLNFNPLRQIIDTDIYTSITPMKSTPPVATERTLNSPVPGCVHEM